MDREVRQMLAEIQSVNDNNPNFRETPIDVGRYIVQLKKVRAVLGEVEALVAAGAAKLPDDILKPICDPW